MTLKYKFKFNDLKKLTYQDFKIYLFALFKAIIPHKKIKDLKELETFIQNKSAWVTQVTLYGYLKTRMGTRYVLHFDNEVFLSSINKAKWNIYIIAIQDLIFFTFSYLKSVFNYKDLDNAKLIFENILENEAKNNMPIEIINEAKKTFNKCESVSR